MMEEKGLNKFNNEALGLLSAMLVGEYRRDGRIGIKGLEIMRRLNKMTENSVRAALRQAYAEVEWETLNNLGDRDMIILAALIRNKDTIKAYSEVSSSNNMFVRGVSKSTFFQRAKNLQNLGLVTLIKKKIGRYYTMES
jgi:cell division control protein 6